MRSALRPGVGEVDRAAMPRSNRSRCSGRLTLTSSCAGRAPCPGPPARATGRGSRPASGCSLQGRRGRRGRSAPRARRRSGRWRSPCRQALARCAPAARAYPSARRSAASGPPCSARPAQTRTPAVRCGADLVMAGRPRKGTPSGPVRRTVATRSCRGGRPWWRASSGVVAGRAAESTELLVEQPLGSAARRRARRAGLRRNPQRPAARRPLPPGRQALPPPGREGPCPGCWGTSAQRGDGSRPAATRPSGRGHGRRS